MFLKIVADQIPLPSKDAIAQAKPIHVSPAHTVSLLTEADHRLAIISMKISTAEFAIHVISNNNGKHPLYTYM